MDAKGRISVPTKIREALMDVCGGKLVMTAHPDENCLLIYPEPQWLEILPKIEALPSFNKKARRTQRLLLGHAAPMEMDGSGRLLVPPTLRDHGRLDKNLMIIGQGKKLEIWGLEHWQSWLDEADDGDMPEEMMSLSL